MLHKIKTLIRRLILCKNRVNGYEKQLSIQARRVIPWEQANGDKTYRLQYDLRESSVCFDLGGYEGQWASDIFSMYCCRIYIFEPVSEFSQKITQRFIKNPNISVYEFGLANDNIFTTMAIGADASSQYKQSESNVNARLVKAYDFFTDNHISCVDLMKINIEGGEYDLLEHLIATGLINRIRNLQIQFHDFFPDAKQRMNEIQNSLLRTHELTYQYEFVWENWTLKT